MAHGTICHGAYVLRASGMLSVSASEDLLGGVPLLGTVPRLGDEVAASYKKSVEHKKGSSLLPKTGGPLMGTLRTCTPRTRHPAIM